MEQLPYSSLVPGEVAHSVVKKIRNHNFVDSLGASIGI